MHRTIPSINTVQCRQQNCIRCWTTSKAQTKIPPHSSTIDQREPHAHRLPNCRAELSIRAYKECKNCIQGGRQDETCLKKKLHTRLLGAMITQHIVRSTITQRQGSRYAQKQLRYFINAMFRCSLPDDGTQNQRKKNVSRTKTKNYLIRRCAHTNMI